MTDQNIYQALAAVMRDIDPVAKDQLNRQQGFKYRGIEQVYNAAHFAMAKHGVISVPYKVIRDNRSERQTSKGGTLYCCVLTVQYRFYAADGSFIETEVQGEGMDSGDKASVKAQSIAHRTAILQVFTVPYHGMIDPDADNPPAEEGPSEELKKSIDACLAASKKATSKQEIRDLYHEAKEDGYLAWVSGELKKMAAVLPEKEPEHAA